MDESSESRSGQYDPTKDYHWQQFELRRLKGSSEDFQQFFEDIMVRARSGFMRVRPYGKDGDRKCDGLFRQEGLFFQVYSPDELKQAQVRRKINEDLDGAIAHWGDELKTWIFVYNVKKGVAPGVLETLQEKQIQYPLIKIDHLGNDGLWEIARELTLQQRSEILGAPPLANSSHVNSKLSQGNRSEADWRETCQILLEHWKGLTTNVLTKSDGVRFQLDEVFVPLGVVERKQQPRRTHSEGSPERGSELYEEKVTPISHHNFFENVLRQGQSKLSEGRRIAIIGEPGAGKTTQLQKIGDWILQETDGIPIWIPLSVVGKKGLKEYLTQDWLPTAISELKVTEHHQDDLAQLLKTGKVWLLLDGVDEMTVADALHHMATQMRGVWLQNVRVVLTCRLNVWEAGKNALDNFDVYRNLDFAYPDEVHQFIDKWFQEKPALQENLKAGLEQPGKERIRDMVKNPLRLTLLCYSWQIRQGELPETKAGLYECFVDAFYEWNKGKVPCKLTSAKRQELNQALGELSREAIDQDSSRFRLKEKFVTCFLGDVDDEDSLFYLALQLGWLNRIGVAEEDPFEGVYAFFHPTFQEYFAATSLQTGEFLLKDNPGEVDNGIYRIFSPEWREVTRLWLGIERDSLNPKKDFLINSLLSFKDGCGIPNFYGDFAFLIIPEIIDEYAECKYLKEVVDQLINTAFGHPESDGSWTCFLPPASWKAQSLLSLESAKEYIFQRLVELLSFLPKNEVIRIQIISCLQNLDPIGTSETISAHLKLLQVSTHASMSLSMVISYLSQRKASIFKDCKLICEIIETIFSKEAIFGDAVRICLQESIEKELEISVDDFSQELLLDKLVSSRTGLIDFLGHLIDNWIFLEYEVFYYKNPEVFEKMKAAFAEVSLPENARIESSEMNLAVEPDLANEVLLSEEHMNDVCRLAAVDLLMDFTEWLKTASDRHDSSHELDKDRIIGLVNGDLEDRDLFPFNVEIDYKDTSKEQILEIVVKQLRSCLSETTLNESPNKFSTCYEIVWLCAEEMSYPDFYKAWHSPPSSQSDFVSG